MASGGGWPYSHPPNCDFDINEKSSQARGLVFWLPLLGNRYGPYRDKVRGHILTPYGSPAWVPDGWIGNAQGFVRSEGSNRLTLDIAPVASAPLSVTAWVYPYSDADYHSVVNMENSTSDDDMFSLQLAGSATSDPVRWRAVDGVVGLANAVGYTTYEWQLVAGVEVSASERRAYAGSVEASNTSTVTPSGVDQITIGARRRTTTPTDYLDGRIFDVRVYNRVVEAEELAIMRGPGMWDLYKPRARLWPAVSLETDSMFAWGDSVGSGILSGVMAGAR